MRIALFTDSYLPDINGVSVELSLIRKALEKRGNEVYVFAPSSRKVKENNKDKNIVYFSSASFKRNPDFRIAFFPFVSAVEKAKNLGIELIHNHAIGTMALAALRCREKLKIPVISTFHYPFYLEEDEHNFTYNLASKYFKWLYSNSDYLTVPSNYAYKKLVKIGVRANIIPNGIDFKFFSKGSSKRRTYDFVYAGSLVKTKNIEMVIEHARNIRNVMKKDITFLIVGDGSHKQALEDYSYMKGVSDYFLWTGLISQNKLREVYWKSKAYLFPSQSDSFSLSVLESMACGVVPVVPEDSAMKEIIKDGENGFIFSDGMDFYRKAVDSIKAGKDLRKKVIETAKNYDINKVIEEYEKAYQKLIKK